MRKTYAAWSCLISDRYRPESKSSVVLTKAVPCQVWKQTTKHRKYNVGYLFAHEAPPIYIYTCECLIIICTSCGLGSMLDQIPIVTPVCTFMMGMKVCQIALYVRNQSIYITRHNESINDDKSNDLHTSTPCPMRSVYVLLMTSQSLADDVTMTRQLWREHVKSDI